MVRNTVHFYLFFRLFFEKIGKIQYVLTGHENLESVGFGIPLTPKERVFVMANLPKSDTKV